MPRSNASGRELQLSGAFILLALVACAAEPAPGLSRLGGAAGSGPSGDAGTIVADKPLCAADNPFCGTDSPTTTVSTGMPMGAPVVTVPTTCGSVPIDLKPAGVNVMIAVDGSAGMARHWSDIVSAIRSLRQNNPMASFGLHVFWADPVDPFATSNGDMSNNGCAAVHNEVLEPGARTADELIKALGDRPQGGMITGAYQVAPVVDSINYYLTNATKLADPQRTNYLLVVTGANDNCFGSAFVGKADKLIAYQKLAIELTKLNIRTIPVGVDPPSASNSMSNAGRLTGTAFGMPIGTDYETLETLLEYGGSGLKEVPRIDSPTHLSELVSHVGQAVSNCRFEIPAALDSSTAVNPFELSFTINSKVVPRDRHQTNGWDFVNGSTNQVEFFGQGCQALQAGQVVQANKSCETNICGTAAVSVETKPRSVLLLLDSSASRTECVDGSFDCLSIPGTAGRPLTFWETVQRAVGASLIAPINDDVAFGLQFFPEKNAQALSCNVATQPEIPPARGKQIAVMKAMLEKLPFGLSPVVAVMESVAAAPGKLADPGVVGAVVLLSDGGDNCSGATQAQMVSRLGGAAKKLFASGVKTFAIRYGSADGETPEQAEQLTAVVTEGGTALKAGKVSYIDAKSESELVSALAGISDRLATCSFKLGGLQANVDKSRTSLFLNGEQIGFDAKATKQDGWNWVDAERTTVELYGEACMAFKTNRRTRVVVEFGCEPIIIKGPD